MPLSLFLLLLLDRLSRRRSTLLPPSRTSSRSPSPSLYEGGLKPPLGSSRSVQILLYRQQKAAAPSHLQGQAQATLGLQQVSTDSAVQVFIGCRPHTLRGQAQATLGLQQVSPDSTVQVVKGCRPLTPAGVGSSHPWAPAGQSRFCCTGSKRLPPPHTCRGRLKPPLGSSRSVQILLYR
jgi:hypothetical protein